MLDDRFKKVIVAVVALTLVVSAAAASGAVSLQEDDDTETESDRQTEEGQTQNSSYLRIAHASPDAPDVNVMVDNETVGENVSVGDVGQYMNVSAGTHNVTITVAGQPNNVLFEGNVTLEPRTVTTLAATGEFSTGADTEFGVTNFTDDAWQPSDEESALRFVHLSPDTDAVDVVVVEGPTEEEAETPVGENETEEEETETPEETETETPEENETETPEDGVANETETPEDGAVNETETPEDGVANETEGDTANETEGDEATNETETPEDGAVNETETPEDGVTNETETPEDGATNETEDGPVNETETPEDGVANETEAQEDEEVEVGTPIEAADTENATVLAENVDFRNASEYMNVPAGNYTLEIREASPDNDGAVLATVNVSVEGGQAYSAMAIGFSNPADSPAGEEFNVTTVQDASLTVNLPDREIEEQEETETPEEEETETPEENETETPEEEETETPEEEETETPEEEETETPEEETETPEEEETETETETETEEGEA